MSRITLLSMAAVVVGVFVVLGLRELRMRMLETTLLREGRHREAARVSERLAAGLVARIASSSRPVHQCNAAYALFLAGETREALARFDAIEAAAGTALPIAARYLCLRGRAMALVVLADDPARLRDTVVALTEIRKTPLEGLLWAHAALQNADPAAATTALATLPPLPKAPPGRATEDAAAQRAAREKMFAALRGSALRGLGDLEAAAPLLARARAIPPADAWSTLAEGPPATNPPA